MVKIKENWQSSQIIPDKLSKSESFDEVFVLEKDENGVDRRVLSGFVIMDKESKMLFLMSTKHNMFFFPGGKMDFNRDKNILETAFREVSEELGLQESDLNILDKSPIYIDFDVDNLSRMRSYLFFCILPKKNLQRINFERDKFDYFKFIGYKAVLDSPQDFSPNVREFLQELNDNDEFRAHCLN